MERKSDVLVTFILPSSTSCVLHQAATAMHGKLLLELWGSADTNQVAAEDLDAHYSIYALLQIGSKIRSSCISIHILKSIYKEHLS